MNVEEIRKKVRSLCEDAGLQFFFAVPNASEWAVTDCEHLRKIVSYHKELETLPLVAPTRKERMQESVLDKIKAEIEALPKTYPFVNHFDMYVKEDDVKKIIDKYKAGEEYEDN